MGRTGLILRQWVERNGCKVIAYQAYAVTTITADDFTVTDWVVIGLHAELD